MSDRPAKIIFAQMRVSGVLVLCADYRCRHSLAISGGAWPNDVRLSDPGPRFVCIVCGKLSAEVRPDFNWAKQVGMMGYR